MNKIKVFEMFSGYGGCSFALKKAGIDNEIVGFSEIDKYAIKCYEQNHKVNFDSGKFIRDCRFRANPIPKNYGDCTKINEKDLPDFDLLTGGFPCQAFSAAGKGLGEQDTRGTLFHEIIRIAEYKKPKYMLLENVKGLMSKRHEETFNKIKDELMRIGYNVKVAVLNSKNYGIPQNRERVWFVCFRNRDDFDKFEFHKQEELKIFLKDILEDEVDEKYYLSKEQQEKLLFPEKHNLSSFRQRQLIKNNICQTLLSAMTHGNTIPLIFDVYNQKIKKDGICITLTEPHHNNLRLIENIKIKNATKLGYQEAYSGDGINLEQPNSKTRRGRVQKQISSTLQTNDQRGVLLNNLRIRKLTPKECFRLMGFLDDEINLEGLSNTQRYKLAGNGWDINLVSKIFKEMFKE